VPGFALSCTVVSCLFFVKKVQQGMSVAVTDAWYSKALPPCAHQDTSHMHTSGLPELHLLLGEERAPCCVLFLPSFHLRTPWQSIQQATRTTDLYNKDEWTSRSSDAGRNSFQK